MGGKANAGRVPVGRKSDATQTENPLQPGLRGRAARGLTTRLRGVAAIGTTFILAGCAYPVPPRCTKTPFSGASTHGHVVRWGLQALTQAGIDLDYSEIVRVGHEPALSVPSRPDRLRATL